MAATTPTGAGSPGPTPDRARPDTGAGSVPTPTAEPPDWPAQAADAIVENVAKVRAKTTGPALKAARYAVFGAFAVLVGTMSLLLLTIGGVRVLNAYLPDAVFGETHMWAAHTILGIVLVLAGLFTSRKMSQKAQR